MVAYPVLDMTPQDYLVPEPLVDRVVALLEPVVAREHVESIVLGGAALAGLVPRIQARVPVPVIDGIAAAVVLAEGLVRLKLPKPSAGSFAATPARDLTGLPPVLSRLFGNGT